MKQEPIELQPATVDAVDPVTKPEVVIASGGSLQAHVDPTARPLEDFVILERIFRAETAEPATVTPGPLGRLVGRTLGSAWVVAARAVRLARRRRTIIAMADDVGIPIALVKALFASPAPLIVIAQHLRSKRARLLFGRLGLHRQVSLFLAISDAHRTLLVEQFGVDPAKVRMLRDTVDVHFFTTDPSVPQRRQIVSAGLAGRDYKTLIEATRDLDVDVKIEANSAWYGQPVNFTEADLHPRVTLCDDGTTTGLRDLYAESEIVAVPLQDIDYSAGYTTILEGMSMGKPVVATRIRVNGDFIDDGETGLLVPPGDVAVLRDRLRRLLDDPAERERLGRAARRSVEERFNRDHYGDVMADAVRSVARRP